MVFEGGDHGHGLVVIVGRSYAVEAGLAGDDFEKDPTIFAATIGGNDFAVLDGERGQAVAAPGDFFGPGKREHGEGCGRLDEVSSIHHGIVNLSTPERC